MLQSSTVPNPASVAVKIFIVAFAHNETCAIKFSLEMQFNDLFRAKCRQKMLTPIKSVIAN